MSKETLADLEVGDQVAMGWREQWQREASYASHPYTIAKITKTQIVLDDGSRWYRADGHRLGSKSGPYRRRKQWITPYTDRHKHREERTRLMSEISDALSLGSLTARSLEKWSTNTLRTLAYVLETGTLEKDTVGYGGRPAEEEKKS